MTENDTAVITKLDEADFHHFVELLKQFARFEKLTPPDTGALKRLKTDCFAKHPPFEVYVAKVANQVAGFLVIIMTYSTFAARPKLFIEDLYVAETHRKLGIGKALFNFARQLARQRKCRRMEWTALSWNTKAIEFYKKQNAVPVEDWKLFHLNFEH